MCRGHFFHYAVVHALYDYRTLLFFFFKFTIWHKKTQFFLSLSLSILFKCPCKLLQKMMIFAEARGSTDEKKKTNFFVWKRNKEKKTTKTFATICALYVYVCTEVFLFTVKWPFIIMEKRDLFLYSNNKNLHRIAKKNVFFLFLKTLFSKIVHRDRWAVAQPWPVPKRKEIFRCVSVAGPTLATFEFVSSASATFKKLSWLELGPVLIWLCFNGSLRRAAIYCLAPRNRHQNETGSTFFFCFQPSSGFIFHWIGSLYNIVGNEFSGKLWDYKEDELSTRKKRIVCQEYEISPLLFITFAL